MSVWYMSAHRRMIATYARLIEHGTAATDCFMRVESRRLEAGVDGG